MKQGIIGILLIVLIIGGAVVFGKSDEPSGTPSNNVYGNENAATTLTEYGDFECPACGAFYPIVAQVKEKFKDSLRFEFKNFPLVNLHANAQAAHRAAEAAAKQGKFWEMHDLLYQNQDVWRSNAATTGHGTTVSNNNPSAIFEGYATDLGLDLDKFKSDVAAQSTLATINADSALGGQLGVTGTPTFFLNGKKIEDQSSISSVEKFSALIENAISEAETKAP